MTTAPLPANEEARLNALRRYDILDTSPEAAFDDLTRLASYICGTPIAMVSLVDSDRQWFKSKVGIDADETAREVAFCAHAILDTDLFVVPDTARDARFADNPLVTSDLNIRFYAGMPLVTEDGHAIGTLCTMDRVPRELTEAQKEALHTLARQALAHLQLRESYARLRELETLRDSLTDMVVHDLRTPLTSLLGGIQTLPALGDLNDDQREFVALSAQSGEILLGMINDLLDVSKSADGSLRLDYAEVSAADVVARAVEQVAQIARQKAIALVAEVASELPPLVADAEKLRRTLVNLLGNALKFTPERGTIIVAVRRDPGDNAFRFSVTDTGEGIPKEAFERIFEKFGQVEERRAGRKNSTGLGLTFCKMAVEAHGGRIWVESEMGKGSTFLFTVPCTP